MKTRKLLKKLCAEYAVSGRENEMSGIITELTEKYAYEIKELPTGTIIAEVGNKKAKRHIMLDAHIDRIGLVVTYINEEGFLKAEPVGGMDLRALAGTVVTVMGSSTKLTFTDGKLYNGSWYQVKLNGTSKTGYVHKDYVRTDEAQSTTAQAASSSTGYINADYVNLRKGAGTGYAIVTTMRINTKFTFVNPNPVNNWYQIKLSNGTTGYVISDYVTKDNQNLLLQTIPENERANYKAGLLIETVRDLDSTEVDKTKKKMLKTDKEIANSYRAVDNMAAQNAAMDALIAKYKDSTALDSKYLNSEISVAKLDNKNELEYAYSFANISQSASSEYRTETTRKDKLYRAYAYLIHIGGSEDGEDVKMISAPVYFTIYDMASIVNDYDVKVTK